MPVRIITSVRRSGVPYPKIVEYLESEVKRRGKSNFDSAEDIEGLINRKNQNRGTEIASEYVYEDLILGKTPTLRYRPAIRKAIRETGSNAGYSEQQNTVNVERLTTEIKVTKDSSGKSHHFIVTKYAVSGVFTHVKKVD